MSLIRCFTAVALLTLIWGQPCNADANEIVQPGPWAYKLGEGLRVADTDLHIGGYINIENENNLDEGEEELSLDEISLFVFGNIGYRWRLFSEIEAVHLWEADTKGESTADPRLKIERLYLDYLSSDRLSIRMGKFLTPVGTWNEIHAEPLTWTVSRPLVTFVAFPEYVTGLQVFGNLSPMDEDISYSIFLQNNESIDEDTGFRETHILYGGRGRWFASQNLEIGVPLLYYKDYEVGDCIYLTGIDFLYQKGTVEIRGEATYGSVDIKDGGWSNEYGYYIQGVYGFTERHFLVARHEYFMMREDNRELGAISAGGVYKLKPQVVFKAEYQMRYGDFDAKDINDSDMVLTSFSVLF